MTGASVEMEVAFFFRVDLEGAPGMVITWHQKQQRGAKRSLAVQHLIRAPHVRLLVKQRMNIEAVGHPG